MQPISIRERETIVFHKKNNETNENISKWTRISVSTITRIWFLYQKTGNCEPRPHKGGRVALVTTETMNNLIERIKHEPDITLYEMIEEYQLPISVSALSRRLKKLGFTYKKRLCIQQHNKDQI